LSLLTEATTADCLIGLTKFKYKPWEAKEVDNGYTCPPIRRDFVGRPTRHVPMMGDFTADWANVFTRSQVKLKNLPADVKDAAQKSKKLDDKYIYQHDKKGLWTVQWREKSGDKTKSRTESLITPSSRPYGKHPFKRVLEMWELTASPDLKDWWDSHKGLSAPDGTPYARDVERWFNQWSTTPNFPMPACRAHPQRLRADDRALYCMKLSIWWNSGVHPWVNNNAQPWQISIWENINRYYYAMRTWYFLHLKEAKAKAAEIDKVTSKVKNVGIKASSKTQQTAFPSPTVCPSSPVAAGPSGSAKASGASTGAAKSTSKAPKKVAHTPKPAGDKDKIPTLHAGQTWAAKVNKEAERDKCRIILDDNELYLMYRTVELGLDPKFPVNIEDAKMRSATTGEANPNALFFFHEEGERTPVAPSDFSVIHAQIQNYIVQQMLDGKINVDANHVNITDIQHREESGAVMIKCGNQFTAVYMANNINMMIEPTRLKYWDTERDDTYKFAFYLPASSNHIPKELFLRVLQSSNPGSFDWITPPKEGYRPVGPFRMFEVTATATQAHLIADRGRIFRFATDYGYIKPAGTDKPRCTLQKGAEVYSDALNAWERYLPEGEPNPYKDRRIVHSGPTMVEVVEEARKPVPGPAVDNLVKEALRVASMAGGHISTTMLQTTPADLKR
jgi:hypothetical protein